MSNVLGYDHAAEHYAGRCCCEESAADFRALTGHDPLSDGYWAWRAKVRQTLQDMAVGEERPHGVYVVRRVEDGWFVKGSGHVQPLRYWFEVSDILEADVR